MNIRFYLHLSYDIDIALKLHFDVNYVISDNVTKQQVVSVIRFFVSFCRLLILSKFILSKVISGSLSEWQTVWIQIKPDVLSGLIWVLTVCKVYQQTAKVKCLGHKYFVFERRN